MIKNRIDPQYFIVKLRSVLASEARNPLEIGAKKQPKMEFLQSITDVIELLFDNLYSVNEQLYLINTIDKNFSLTDTSYFKFLNTYFKDEYTVLKKNRLLVSKIKIIKDGAVNITFIAEINRDSRSLTNVVKKMAKNYREQKNNITHDITNNTILMG